MGKQRKPYVLTPEDYFSREERKQIMKYCQERSELDLLHGRQTWPIRYLLVDLAMFSGLRVAEITALKVGDLYLQGNDPCLIVRHGKGGKKRTVYIDKDLRGHLKSFIDLKKKSLNQSADPEAPLFSGREGKHSPPITLMKSFKEAVKCSGVRKVLSVHSARHTYATFLLKDTGNLRYVQQQLGHASISMTAHYANILPEENGKLANMIKRDQ